VAAVHSKLSEAQQLVIKVYVRRMVADRVVDAGAQERLRRQLLRLQTPDSPPVAPAEP
jgi:hypothetical protein